MNFEHGNLHGECRRWHSNGLCYTLANYNHGKLYGEFFEWDKQGNVKRHTIYDNGVDIMCEIES
jgi:antitoxin component YwqK of YwqJK toxin-antitoxin module